MNRTLTALCALSVLGACSSSGTSPIVSAVKEVILPSKSDELPTTKTAPLTRERIEKFGLALIRGRIEGEDVTNLLTGTAVNGNYVTYISAFRQNVTMLGTLVTGTRGLGGDLLGVRSDANDPIATLTPVKDWPAQVTRDYIFPGVGPSGVTTSVTCNLSAAAETKLTIVEVTYEVTPFTEVCTGDGVQFTNTYMAETVTGQIWQTKQWIGEKRGFINIEVLEPFSIE